MEITHRHKKRGTTYTIIGTGKVQTEVPLKDYDRVVVYIGDERDIWVRPVDEFNDGRFEELPYNVDLITQYDIAKSTVGIDEFQRNIIVDDLNESERKLKELVDLIHSSGDIEIIKEFIVNDFRSPYINELSDDEIESLMTITEYLSASMDKQLTEKNGYGVPVKGNKEHLTIILNPQDGKKFIPKDAEKILWIKK